MPQNIVVREVGKETLEEQVRIFNRVFGINMSLETWTYKHYENPLGASKAFIAFDGNKAVGINMFIPMQYVYAGQIFNAVQSCDSSVDPDYRRKGIFSKIILFAEHSLADKGYDLIIGYPGREKSFPGFLKLGWNHVCNLSNMFIMRNVAKIIDVKFHVTLPTWINRFTNLKITKIKNNADRIKNLHLDIVETLPFTDEEYKQMIVKEHISFYVNKDIIAWKFAKSRYIFYTVCEDKTVIAGFIVDCRTDRGLCKANVIAHFKNTHDTQKFSSAFSLLLVHLWEKTDYINTWKTKSQIENNITDKNGFITVNEKIISLPFITRILTKDKDKINMLMNNALWNPENIEIDSILNA
jgi:GNAT superfamily N-acetyltransferase